MKKKMLLLSLILIIPILFNNAHATHEVLEIKNYTEGTIVGEDYVNHTVFNFELDCNATYLIIFTGEFTSGATNTVSKIRYVFNNETISELVQQPKDITHYYGTMATVVENLTSGNYTALVQYAGIGGGTTSKVRNVKIQVIEPTTTMMVVNLSLSPVLTASWITILNLTFVANLNGNYSILSNAIVNATTLDDSQLRVLVNGTLRQSLQYTGNSNEDFKGIHYQEIYNLTTGDSLNITLLAQSNTPVSQVQNAKIIVLKHLNGVFLNQSDTGFSTGGGVFIEVSKVDLAPQRTGLHTIIVTAEQNSSALSTDFDIKTEVNGSIVCRFLSSRKTIGDVYNYVCLDSINVIDLDESYEIITSFQNVGGGTAGISNVRTLVTQLFIAIINTDLILTLDEFFAINDDNLVQANYTYALTDLPVENATCEFNSTTGNGTMAYNSTSLQYEIFVIPDESDIGIIEFSINCSKEDLETQIQDQQYFSGIFAGNPYNITIRLWENLNATIPYLDEFAYIMIHGLDYNCTPVTSFEECWRVNEYNNGVAYNNDTIGVGNFSIWFYSGEVTQDCDLCPPHYETLNNLKELSSINPFVFNEGRTELNLYINPLELNFEKALFEILLSDGLRIILLIIAFSIAIIVGVIGFIALDKNVVVSILIFALTLWSMIYIFQVVFQIDLGAISILSMLLP